METILINSELNLLREKGIINDDEIALWVGDLIVAENVCTKHRRIIDAQNVLAESRRRVLKG
jgi:hypothetical protein|tara:strand:+ start:541 stop:726 length:186 start_codon:yes stop_codon:yes gene_type:complete